MWTTCVMYNTVCGTHVIVMGMYACDVCVCGVMYMYVVRM